MRQRLSDLWYSIPWFWVAIAAFVIVVVLELLGFTGPMEPGNWNDPDPRGG